MEQANAPHVTGLILAGGQNRRMGRDKALIEFHDKPLVAHVLERVQPLCSETLIVANNSAAYARFGCPIVGDVFPGMGSLGGIFSGLQAAHEPYALAVACDMPFLNQELLRYLISLTPGFDVIVPQAMDPSRHPWPPPQAVAEADAAPRPPAARRDDLHPLHAVYSKACLPAMERRLRDGDLRLVSLFDQLRVRIVTPAEVDTLDPRHRSFFNVNTPEDLQHALALDSGGK